MPEIGCLNDIWEHYDGILNRDEKIGLHQALKKIRERTGMVPIITLRSAGIPPKPKNPARATNRQGINERM